MTTPRAIFDKIEEMVDTLERLGFSVVPKNGASPEARPAKLTERCKSCDRRFSTPQALRMHVFRVHEKRGPQKNTSAKAKSKKR